jgi:hypothetical protein
MTAKLTKVQQVQLNELKNGPLYVGNNCPGLMRTFDKLAEKGLAQVIKTTDTGKKYQAI